LMPSVAGEHPTSSELIPQNTLMGLPNELLIKIIGYAVTSDYAINLYPEIFHQDLRLLRDELLAPFAEIPRLLAIAKAGYFDGNLIYRTSLGHQGNIDQYRAAIYDPSATVVDGGTDDREDLGLAYRGEQLLPWFGYDHDLPRVVRLADRIHHVEILMPMHPLGGAIGGECQQRVVANKIAYRFMLLGKAFPELRSLVVRVTTYRIPEREVFYSEASSQGRTAVRHAGNCPEFVALEFRRMILSVVKAVDAMRSSKLKQRSIVLFQEKERDWHQWRDGPLSQPTFEVSRAKFDHKDIESFVWRMMDLPSCRATL